MKTTSLPALLWDRFDRWLCQTLYGPIRVRWAKLWVREDEDHPSLGSHPEYYDNLSEEKRNAYWNDLIHRRQIAHNRDLIK